MPSAGENTKWLESLSPWPEEFGLDRIRALLHAVGDPHRAFRSIHVVGTNGKTTTTRLAEALLADEGISVGAYTSPHVVGWEERIRMGGAEADLEWMVRDPLHAAGNLDAVGCAGVDRASQECLDSRNCEREIAVARHDDPPCTRGTHLLLPLRLAQDGKALSAQDRELLGGDLLPRAAEHIGVLERHIREDDDGGIKDVVRVVATAETRLHHRDIDLRFREREQRSRGHDLELCRGARMRSYPRDRRLEVRLRSGDTNPLAPASNVRRQIRAHA